MGSDSGCVERRLNHMVLSRLLDRVVDVRSFVELMVVSGGGGGGGRWR